jgi:hypothetical protein
MMGEFWINVLIVVTLLLALWLIWGLLRALIGFLDRRLHFLTWITPGDVAGGILVVIATVMFLAAVLTYVGERS